MQITEIAGKPLQPCARALNFKARDITGTHVFDARGIHGGMAVSAVAASLAATMRLPRNVHWTLRDDATSAYLEDSKPVSEQLRPHSRVTVAPKTHFA